MYSSLSVCASQFASRIVFLIKYCLFFFHIWVIHNFTKDLFIVFPSTHCICNHIPYAQVSVCIHVSSALSSTVTMNLLVNLEMLLISVFLNTVGKVVLLTRIQSMMARCQDRIGLHKHLKVPAKMS